MEMDKMQVVWKNQKELRCGYTTGSCAAAAAKAAAAMLFSGEEVRQVSLMTPKGIELYLEVEEIQRENESVSCAIQKDSGDDPDVTNGIFVYAKVTKKKEKGMTLDGGIGVGRFTRKVLKMDGLLLVGHIGKLVKIAAGVMNTHSRQADARMEVLAVHAAMAGADRETVCALMKCFTTKEALDILEERGLLEETMRTVMEKIEYHLAKRAGEKMKVGALMFSDELGVLGKTSLVEKLREKIG